MVQLTNKQRAYLSSLAVSQSSIISIGKSSLTPEVVKSVDQALEARELVKVHVLKNCLDDPHEAANTLAERTNSALVRVIGRVIILYRPAKKPLIQLP